MPTTIQKWGNSLGLRIPKEIASQTNLTAGTRVDVEAGGDGALTIRAVRRQKPKLKDLVARITPANRHAETDWGKAVGKEAW